MREILERRPGRKPRALIPGHGGWQRFPSMITRINRNAGAASVRAPRAPRGSASRMHSARSHTWYNARRTPIPGRDKVLGNEPRLGREPTRNNPASCIAIAITYRLFQSYPGSRTRRAVLVGRAFWEGTLGNASAAARPSAALGTPKFDCSEAEAEYRPHVSLRVRREGTGLRLSYFRLHAPRALGSKDYPAADVHALLRYEGRNKLKRATSSSS